jgi:hypothetical protein
MSSATADRAKPTITVFLSFAADDKSAAKDLWAYLQRALAPSRDYQWKLWSFTDQLLVGDDFDVEIKAAIADSDLGLFALSNAFLGSDYIRRIELPPFLDPGKGKRIAPVALKQLAQDADLHGLAARQIFSYHDPYWSGRTPHKREAWAIALADELHRVARRYGLGR